MKTPHPSLKILTVGILIALSTSGCKHSLEVVGQGDILELRENTRGCSYEQSVTAHPQCTENQAVEGDHYQLTYEARPRPGWRFSHWEGTACAQGSKFGQCAYEVPPAWVSLTNTNFPDFDMGTLSAVFEPDPSFKPPRPLAEQLLVSDEGYFDRGECTVSTRARVDDKHAENWYLTGYSQADTDGPRGGWFSYLRPYIRLYQDAPLILTGNLTDPSCLALYQATQDAGYEPVDINIGKYDGTWTVILYQPTTASPISSELEPRELVVIEIADDTEKGFVSAEVQTKIQEFWSNGWNLADIEYNADFNEWGLLFHKLPAATDQTWSIIREDEEYVGPDTKLNQQIEALRGQGWAVRDLTYLGTPAQPRDDNWFGIFDEIDELGRQQTDMVESRKDPIACVYQSAGAEYQCVIGSPIATDTQFLVELESFQEQVLDNPALVLLARNNPDYQLIHKGASEVNTDGDDIPDYADACPYRRRPFDLDQDRDSIGDACDGNDSPLNDSLRFGASAMDFSSTPSGPILDAWDADGDGLIGDNDPAPFYAGQIPDAGIASGCQELTLSTHESRLVTREELVPFYVNEDYRPIDEVSASGIANRVTLRSPATGNVLSLLVEEASYRDAKGNLHMLATLREFIKQYDRVGDQWPVVLMRMSSQDSTHTSYQQVFSIHDSPRLSDNPYFPLRTGGRMDVSIELHEVCAPPGSLLGPVLPQH